MSALLPHHTNMQAQLLHYMLALLLQCIAHPHQTMVLDLRIFTNHHILNQLSLSLLLVLGKVTSRFKFSSIHLQPSFRPTSSYKIEETTYNNLNVANTVDLRSQSDAPVVGIIETNGDTKTQVDDGEVFYIFYENDDIPQAF